MQTLCGFAVCGMSFLCCCVISEMKIFAFYANRCSPLAVMKRHSFVSTFVVNLSASILVVLRWSSNSQIVVRAIQRIVVFVVALAGVAKVKSQNKSMKKQRAMFGGSHGIVGLSLRLPLSAPLPLIQFLKSMQRDFCELSLSKRDKAVRCFRGHAHSSKVGRIRPVLQHLTP